MSVGRRLKSRIRAMVNIKNGLTSREYLKVLRVVSYYGGRRLRQLESKNFKTCLRSRPNGDSVALVLQGRMSTKSRGFTVFVSEPLSL